MLRGFLALVGTEVRRCWGFWWIADDAGGRPFAGGIPNRWAQAFFTKQAFSAIALPSILQAIS